ncbi:amino acid adenylation domain-containing protein, partial [Pseudomonas syringae]
MTSSHQHVSNNSNVSYELSSVQQGIWLGQIANPDIPLYNIGMKLEIKGDLDIPMFEKAINLVVRHNDALRLALFQEGDIARQRVLPSVDITFELVDFSDYVDSVERAQEYLQHAFSRPFNPLEGILWEAQLVRCSASRHYWLGRYHHLVMDGSGATLFCHAVAKAYNNLLVGIDELEEGSSYRDFLVKDQAYLNSPRLERDRSFWRERYAQIPPSLLQWSGDHAVGSMCKSGHIRSTIKRDLFNAVAAVATEHGLSPVTVFFAVVSAYFSRVGGAEEVIIGMPLHNRTTARQKQTIGMFSSVIPVGVRVDPNRSLLELMGDVAAELRRCYRHEHFPIAELNRALNIGHSRRKQIFDITLSFEKFDADFVFGGAPSKAIRMYSGFDQTPLSIAICDYYSDEDVVVDFNFNLACFRPDEVERIRDRITLLLESVAAHESTPIGQLALMGKAERRQVLVEFNATHQALQQDLLVHQLFEQQAQQQPQALALVCGDQRVTYAELSERSNQVADVLLSLGIAPDDRVAICVERSVEMVVGLLGILKAGGAYVPLDPGYPPERLHYMLEDSAPVAVLVQRTTRDLLGALTMPVLDLQGVNRAAEARHDRVLPTVTPQHLAYVIYTSGSTGQPKGVMIEHRNLVNLVAWHCEAFNLTRRKRVSSVAGVGFDACVWELWPALCVGASLSLLPGQALGNDVDALLGWWRRQELDVSFLPTPIAEIAFAQGIEPASLQTLLIGGDRLRQFPNPDSRVALINNYGPTETTVVATSGLVDATQSVLHIGRPIANTQVYLLDAHGQPVPIGVSGEIYIGGAGVARGYLNRPELTAERFLDDPFSAEPAARMYRSGDLGRWLADGNIEYLGRNDDQVKLRGVRIELGEIEAQLRQIADIRDAVVIAQEDTPGEKRLTAYYTIQEAAQAITAQTLRAALQARLPEYMVPAAYVKLSEWPLTPNGKLDRRALPAPGDDAYASRDYEAPAGEVERALADIWQELLGVDRAGRNDHFFELGGHSLLAMRLISLVRQRLNVELELAALFAHPQLEALACVVAQAQNNTLPQIVQTSREARLPLSFAQQRLWFLAQMEGASAAYHIPAGLRIVGALDEAALQRALNRIVARHEVLRTTFVQTGDQAVELCIHPEETGCPLRKYDLTTHADSSSELARLMNEEAIGRFDLQQGPLIRGSLVRLSDEDHVLLLTMHHIVSDGWSMGVLTRELGALYASGCQAEADPLPQLSIQYADYAVWQRGWLSGAVLHKQSTYWQTALLDAPALLMLPSDRVRPAQQDYTGDAVPVVLDATLSHELKALSRRHGTTLFMTLLAGWATVLSRLSGQDEVVIGSPVANRMSAEVGGLIGFFVNTLALRVNVSNDPTVETLLSRVKACTLAAYEHQDLPFEQVVELLKPVRSLSHSPLFQAMLSWQNTPPAELALAGLELTLLDSVARTTKYDVSLDLAEVEGRIVGSLEYATALFDRETAQRYVAYLERVLRAMVENERQVVGAIELLGETERRQVLVEFNATQQAWQQDLLVHQLFEQQAQQQPQALALVCGDERVTYADLNERSNQVADVLLSLGIAPDDRVAICVERSVEMVVGLLGILKAGGAYVPLDPGYPPERLHYMLEDSAPVAVLVQRTTRDLLGALTMPVLDLQGVNRAAEARHDRVLPTVTPQHLAYVIYTSGSTGQPKGVMIEHRAIVNRLLWAQDQYRLSREDRVLQKTPFGFDVSVWEFFLPLLAGAQLVIARPGGHQDPEYLAGLIADSGVTILHFVPSMLQSFLNQAGPLACSTLRQVFCSGEALPYSLQKHFEQRFAHVQLHNLYGPTEAAVDVTYWHCVPDLHAGIVPIGRPVANTRMYLLDPHMQPVPVGVCGEIYIAGIQLARGYLNRDALTAERFVKDRFSNDPTARMYRSGDLGRWLADGNIEYLGRNDDQVKLRGFRIELGEIEAQLAGCPGVGEAVVIAREDTPGDKRLIAYYTTREAKETIAVQTLRAALQASLPEYMVPAAYVKLPGWPLTPNGKLNRRALPVPEADAYVSRGYEAPCGTVERALAEIWQELLGVERVGRHDHFFELGGHSLLAVSLMGRMRQAGLSADVRMLFAQPTLSAFAEVLGNGHQVEVPANGIVVGCTRITPSMLPLADLSEDAIERIVRAVPGGTANVQDIYALAPLQEGVLFHHLASVEGDPYLLNTRFALPSEDHLKAFVRALQGVIARHDILRTAVLWEGLDEPVQTVWREAPLAVEALELKAADGDIEQQLQERFDPRHYRLDLTKAPLMKMAYAYDEANSRWVAILLFHHMVLDHMALEVVQHEVQADLLGQAAGLPDSVPYRNHVAQARLGVSQAAHEAFFQEMLGQVTEPTLPFGLHDVQGDGRDIKQARQAVSADLAGRIRRQARSLGVSAASLHHLAWAQVLGRTSGREDVVFGTVLLGRMQGGDGADRSLGMFINTLPLCLNVGEQGVREGVKATHARLTALLGHEHASLALAQRCSAIAPPLPLFSALLNYRHSAEPQVSDQGDRAWGGIEVLGWNERTNYPLTLAVDDLGEGFALTVQATAGIDPQRVCAYMETALESLVDALEHSPESLLRSLEMLPRSERQLLQEWNATAVDYPQGTCVHQLFEAQVEKTPEAIALVFEARTFTYAQLNARANQLAHHLLGLGIGPDDRVAICVERSPEMVVGLLGILKAGAAYVPLDPAYPEQRLRYMLEDSAPAAVLVQSATRALPGELAVPLLDLEGGCWEAEADHDPVARAVKPDHLAYVIYTSGSSGQPKGVLIEQRGFLNLMHWYLAELKLASDDAVLLVSSYSFDLTQKNILGPLLVGGTLHLAREAFIPEVLLEQIQRECITHINLSPSAFNTLIDANDSRQLDSIRRVVLGGEPIQVARLEMLPEPRPEFINSYGPTECSDVVAWHRLVDDIDCYRSSVFPIGRPISNTRIYLLDAHGQPVPIGVSGEIHIGGAGVARGYLNLPELTAERFLDDPFSAEPAARMYRSGDLGRWLADGNIEYLGRNDDQVKLRGFRIELGEIESQLAACPGVREAVVLVREHRPGDKRLVAYLTAQEGAVLSAAQLREQLSQGLAEYMIPSAFVTLTHFPLTPNGKLDRRALPAPEDDAYASRDYEAPAGEVEHALAEIWQALLGLERVGRHDHFFELGGHSLLAVQLVSRLRQRFEVEVALRDVFAEPTLQGLARRVANARLSAQTPLTLVDRNLPLPLSWAQQRLWFLDQLDRAAGAAYHIPAGLRLRGRLNRDALQATLDRIVARHETLRTHFALHEGQAIQVIAPETQGFALASHDLRALDSAAQHEAVERLAGEEALAPFDLSSGPLIRGRLVQLSETEHILLVTQHHIVSDGWSTGVLLHEIGTLYRAFSQGLADPLPALAFQYVDYAAWQRRWLQGETLHTQVDFWRQHLSGAPALLELPTDHRRPPLRSYSGGRVSLALSPALTAGLRQLGQRHGATLFMTLLVGWSSLLSRFSGQDDVVIGTPVANRPRSELESLIGFFVNTLALRIRPEGHLSVAALLEQVKAVMLAAHAHQDLPFEQVVEALQPPRSLAHSPIFQVMLALNNTPGGGELSLPELSLEPLQAPHTTAQFDLSLALVEADGGLIGSLEYASDLFERATIERMAGHLQVLLEGMVADDQQSVAELPLLSCEQRRQVLESFNDTAAAYPADKLIHQLFEEQAAQQPDALAVVDDAASLTYGELNARANRLAHYLIGLGIQPDDRVAICAQRSLEMVVGLLGILKAGGAYVPLDPGYPPERLRYMLEDSAPVAVLVQEALQECLPAVNVPQVVLGSVDLSSGTGGLPCGNPDLDAPGLASGMPAYVMYTSGSSGVPKGVLIEHRSVLRLVINNPYARITTEDCVAHGANTAFDASTWEIWSALLNGAKLLVVSQATLLNPARLNHVLIEGGVTALWLTAGLFNEYVDVLAVAFSKLRYLLVGGDVLDPVSVAKVLSRAHRPRHLINGYGPTETTTFASTYEIHALSDNSRSIPIGRPIGNTRIYLLDAHGQPVPIGVSGEIHIGGAGVARGYLNLPELTAERFLDDPFSAEPAARMYRSGDLGRWLADGNIEYLGRNDDQVKLRGFRIELGEIESQLAACPGVREAVVLVREHRPGDKRLVAYLTAQEGALLSAAQLREQLSQGLAEYMIPSAFVTLARFPLTPNGKLDRRALPAPEDDAYASRGYEAPAGEIEHALAEIWQALLGLERVGRHDHFFELGGHSLLAVQLVSRLRQRFEVEVALRDVFAEPTLQGLARQLANARLSAQTPLTSLTPVDRNLPLPLSWAQQRLWFLDQLDRAAGAAYHIPAGLRLRGRLDSDALQATLDRIVARHETLRTHFALHEGQAIQVIAPETQGFALATHDLRALDSAAQHEAVEQLAREEALAPFDLSSGPLIRGRLVQLSETKHILLVTQHHIVSDGWSTGVLLHEIGTLYRAFSQGLADPLPALAFQYVDYAAWQRQWLQGETLHTQVEFWRQHLSGAPALLELPTDHRRPPLRSYAGGRVSLALSPALTAGLRQLCQRHGATLFMTLLVGWSSLLSRFSGQDDVVIGTPVANRPRSELESLIGFFVNTLALRIRPEGRMSVAALLEQVKAVMLAAHAHQDLPFEQVVEALQPPRSLGHSPIFQVMLALNNTPGGGELSLPELSLEPLQAPHTTAQFDLSLALVEADGGLIGSLEYASDLFERATIERMAGHLQVLLEGMVADDQQSVGELPLLSCEQRRQVLESFNDTVAAYPADKLIHQLFEEQVAQQPDALAVVDDAGSLTYGELNARANRLAHYLIGLGIQPDDRVAICAQRSLEMVVGLLGIFKAGGAYVPLDPAYPEQRLRYMLEDSAPVAVLVQAETRRLLGELAVRTLDLQEGDWEVEPEHNPVVPAITPQHLAYVIYTSGSSGKPKGVGGPHQAMVNRLYWMHNTFGGQRLEKHAQKTSISFLDSVTETLMPLLFGAQLHIVSPLASRDPLQLWQAVTEHQLTRLVLVPSLLEELSRIENRQVSPEKRLIVCSGEVFSSSLLARTRAWLPSATILNFYGSSEAAGDSTFYLCDSAVQAGHSLPIGRPIANTRIYLLDAHGQPVPIGVIGEIHIGGAGVARGYLNMPELTAERFLDDPFSAEPTARMYRSGDLGRWLADGNIEYLGRNDDQVKLRGFRIELGEIESQLAACPGVREAVVVAREHRPGDKRLVAYLTAQEGAVLSAAQLREQLSQGLAEYMIPSAFVTLARFPQTPSGKLDRRALPAPEDDAYASRDYEAPAGEVEHALAEIWQALLGLERVGRHDHFFELGGHSLLAVQLVSRLRQRFEVEVALRDVFAEPTLQGLARQVANARLSAQTPLTLVDRDLPLPLSWAQQRLRFLDQLDRAAGAAYHIPAGLRLRGRLDSEALQATLDRIVARHETLRTHFALHEGQAIQVIAPETQGFALVTHDLRALDSAVQHKTQDETQPEAVERLAREEALAPFDLSSGPLIRGRLVQLSQTEHILLVTQHHIVSDGWSTGVLLHEIGMLYRAFSQGLADPLPALAFQYVDYAAWQRRWLQGETLQTQVDFWRQHLSGAPALLELPTDHRRPPLRSYAGGRVSLALSPALTAGLRQLGQRHGATLFMTLLAGWSSLLSRFSGQDDVVIGTPVANRPRSELESLIGFFVNTLALRIRPQGGLSVAALLEQVKAVMLAAHAHQDLPFEQVVEALQPPRSLGHSPIFQVMLALNNTPGGGELSLPELSLEPLQAPHTTAQFDLSLALVEADGGLIGSLEYASDLFERATIERMAGHLQVLLEGMVADDQQAVGQLPLLSCEQRRQVLESFNDTAAAYPADTLLHQLFEEQVAQQPDAPAVVDETGSLTYGELNARANRLAHYLIGLGIQPDDRVAICAQRSLEMVVGLLGILKAGGAYVPLDPGYPPERLRYMLEDSAPVAVLVQGETRTLLGELAVPTFDLQDADWEVEADHNPVVPAITPQHLAYVIYTSGSTGKPKGVANQHDGVVNRLWWAQSEYRIGADDRVLQKTPFGFDVSVWEIFLPLLTGAQLVMARPGGHQDPHYLMEVIERRSISMLHFVPSMLQAFVNQTPAGRCSTLKRVLCSGEALPHALLLQGQAHFPKSELHNLYGPTEAAIDVTAWHYVAEQDIGIVPIGRPIANTQIYLLDAHGQPVPIGVSGEIHIGGIGVARGYLNRPELTAERFLEDPFSAQPTARMYRSGDLGRWLADGNIEYLGRNDDQVKLRGYLIELGEIESQLAGCPGVREAVVLAREHCPGDKRLVAYLTAQEGAVLSAAQLREQLSQGLAEYMIPSAFVTLTHFPLTPNG